MKKLFLAVLCAGLFFACNNKKQAEQTEVVDTVACEEVVEAPVEEVEAVVEPVAENTAKKAATPAKNTTAKKGDNGLQAAKKNEVPTVEEHAKSAANRVANKAIDKAETEATNTIVNSGKKRR